MATVKLTPEAAEQLDRLPRPIRDRVLRVLERARLIERRREGRVHLIRARPAGLQPAQQWMAQCAAGWQFSFDTLESLLEKEARKEGKP